MARHVLGAAGDERQIVFLGLTNLPNGIFGQMMIAKTTSSKRHECLEILDDHTFNARHAGG